MRSTFSILFVTMSVVLSIIVSVLMYIFYEIQINQATQNLIYNSKALTQAVSRTLINDILENDISSIEQSSEFLLASNKNIYKIVVWNEDNKTILNMEKRKNQEITISYSNEELKIPKMSDDYMGILEEINTTRTIGYVMINFSTDSLSQIKNNFIKIILELEIIMVFAIFVISYFISRFFSKDLLEISNFSQKIDKSKGLKLALNTRFLEIYEIVKSLNTLSISLKKDEDIITRHNLELQELVNTETQKRITQERMLQQQSKMALMGEMIGNIAHQWRQPLNQIEALKDAIVEDYEFDDLTKEKMQAYGKQTTNILEYMSKTIDDFRNFFLPSKEKMFFNVCEAIKSSVDLVSASLKSHNIGIGVKLCENCKNCKAINGFPSEFTQVIINIINNAKDALIINKVENALISIEVVSDESKMLITIADNAGGIPENIMDKIFEPYFTTKFASKGTGLGLYMSKLIIEDSMRGKLSVKNGRDGAIFTIEL